jgi:hypothetical protein
MFGAVLEPAPASYRRRASPARPALHLISKCDRENSNSYATPCFCLSDCFLSFYLINSPGWSPFFGARCRRCTIEGRRPPRLLQGAFGRGAPPPTPCVRCHAPFGSTRRHALASCQRRWPMTCTRLCSEERAGRGKSRRERNSDRNDFARFDRRVPKPQLSAFGMASKPCGRCHAPVRSARGHVLAMNGSTIYRNASQGTAGQRIGARL